MKSLQPYLIAMLLPVLVSACSKPSLESEAAVKEQAQSGARGTTREAVAPALDELMERSGMNAQAAQMSANIMSSADSELKKGIPNAETIRVILVEAFNPGALRDVTRNYLHEHLEEKHIDASLTWLNSMTGQKITQLEKKYSGQQAQQAMATQYVELAKNERRVSMVNELDRAIQSTDSTVNIVLALQEAMLLAMQSALPPEQRVPVEAMKTASEKAREDMRKQYQWVVEAAYLHNYQDLSDEELQAYIGFANSDSGKRYHIALAESLQTAVTVAGQNAGEAIAQLNVNSERK